MLLLLLRAPAAAVNQYTSDGTRRVGSVSLIDKAERIGKAVLLDPKVRIGPNTLRAKARKIH